jgi:hypothetical protein
MPCEVLSWQGSARVAVYKMPAIFADLYPDLYPRAPQSKKANPKIGLTA